MTTRRKKEGAHTEEINNSYKKTVELISMPGWVGERREEEGEEGRGAWLLSAAPP